MANSKCFQKYDECFTSHDLIMIKNLQGGYYFAKFNNGCAESPIFKLKKRMNDYGHEQLQLIVMEVLYPEPLYNTNTTNKNILRAIRDGMAVARETDTLITFTLNTNYKTELSEIKEITYVNRIEVQDIVSVICDATGKSNGTFQVNSASLNNRNYEFYLASNASYGRVEVNSKTGSWMYTSLANPIQRDSFTLLVWDGFGSWATQQVLIKLKGDSTSSVQDVNLVNVISPVPIIPTGSLPVEGCVNVVNSPTVRIDQPISVVGSVKVDNSINIANTPLPVIQAEVVPVEGCVHIVNSPIVRIDQPLSMTGAINLDSSATIAITGTPTVLINQPVDVTGIVNLDSKAMVTISGTPTVVIDQPVQVTLVDLPVSITTGVVTITGVEVGMALTSIQLASENLAGTTTFVTEAIDMSQFADFVYLIHSESNSTAVTGYTIQAQIAAINNPNYFLNSGNTEIIGLNPIDNVAVDTEFMAQYTRLAITGGDASSSAFVEVYLQAQYLY